MNKKNQQVGGWLVGRLVVWSVGWLVGWLVDFFGDWLVSGLVCGWVHYLDSGFHIGLVRGIVVQRLVCQLVGCLLKAAKAMLPFSLF